MDCIKSSPTIHYDIYMAGDIDNAKRVCRGFCFDVGFCVNIEPVSYIYKGGEESGFRIGIINYPRFPATDKELHTTSFNLAKRLMVELNQLSFCLVGDKKTEWFSRREE